MAHPKQVFTQEQFDAAVAESKQRVVEQMENEMAKRFERMKVDLDNTYLRKINDLTVELAKCRTELNDALRVKTELARLKASIPCPPSPIATSSRTPGDNGATGLPVNPVNVSRQRQASECSTRPERISARLNVPDQLEDHVEAFSFVEPSIVEELGKYDRWSYSAEVASAERYVLLRDFMATIQIWKDTNFGVKASRDQVLDQMRTMDVVRPFSRVVRFPVHLTVINIDHGVIAGLLTSIRDAVSFGEKMVDQTGVIGNTKSYGSMGDARMAFSKALTRLSEIIRISNPNIQTRYGIYNRMTLENTLRIIWSV